MLHRGNPHYWKDKIVDGSNLGSEWRGWMPCSLTLKQ